MSEHRIPPGDREREPENPMGKYEERESRVHPPEGQEEDSHESPETLSDDETDGG